MDQEEKREDYEEATKILSSRIRLEPDNYETYHERAICNHKLGNYPACLDDLDEAIRLNPSDHNTHCLRGTALCGLNRLNEAITSFKKAIELRARQQDSKLSDIFYLLKVAADETKAAKEKWEAAKKQTMTGTTNSPSGNCGPTNFRDTSELIPRQESSSGFLNGDPVDSTTDQPPRTVGSITSPADETLSHKRVMVTPSSSMPATGQNSSIITNREDSYSSKYKRLRRDRERARRGTSKLCTIKPADLEELKKLSKSNSDKKSMRVIAPIDGWLYSGQLSFDNSNLQDGDEELQYVVRLDGDTSGSSYLFNQETVLNDVIKEVRVKSVSELRKGARICCYWSRTYKCLSTGVVTSRTFEATKSLVSVKYDNGDLSALPLEDLRLLPPDYPKYMSNCDPLLLANAGDQTDRLSNLDKNGASCRSIVIDGKSSNFSPCATYSRAIRNVVAQSEDLTEKRVDQDEDMDLDDPTTSRAQVCQPDIDSGRPADRYFKSPLDDETIPPTRETIDFITSEANLEIQDDDEDILDQQSGCEPDEDEVPPIKVDNSRASSEENNYGVEYRPWVFEGPPKRSKRNGRIYRDTYSAVRRGNEVLSVGDSAELMPRDESIMPFIAKIDGLWATSRGEMRVRVRWYYRLAETEGEQYELEDGDNALFETDHFDENDVQSIWRTTKILSWTDYCKDHIGHVNKPSDGPKIFYLAGYYDPVRRIKHLRSDVKGLQ